MEETWIDWHPKVGDIKPEKYRVRFKGDRDDPWDTGGSPNRPVSMDDLERFLFQIPVPVVSSPEDRPPWIDPQCKFRWGDRVRLKNSSRVGPVGYVINPHDTTEPGGGSNGFTVMVARSLSYTFPYNTSAALDKEGNWHCNTFVDKIPENDLELFPEELPQHFDDRLLDADQPQEQPKAARVPREIRVNIYPDTPLPSGGAHETRDRADRLACTDRIECVHFREVLSDDLSNIQYSPGG